MSQTWEQFVGQVVDGRFRLLEFLGGTDHSAVFLTSAGEHGRAAIKLVAADSRTTEAQLERWESAARLSHPHLVRLFDRGRYQLGDAAMLYVVMESAQENLSQVIPQRALTSAEAQSMLLPVLDALAFLHGNGFVHGHLKPSNVMAVDEQIKLSSHGLRRIGEPPSTADKLSIYDAPETASAGATPATDVWSLGVTLVESLTQRPPALDTTAPVLPGMLPEPFAEIARHCLEADPQRRWTVGEIKAHLQPATPVAQEERTFGEPKARRNWAYSGAAAVVLVLLATLLLPRLHKRAPAPAQAAPAATEQPAPKAPTEAVAGAAVIKQVVPDVPRSASATIRGTIKVRVKVAVDASGNVARATLASPGPSKYFANLALEAARGWQFRPANVDGQNLPAEWMLEFRFQRSGTRAIPVQITR
jgi:TonB family protein